MKAIVIGGGIVGMCSAYYLQQAGYEVVLADKGDGKDNCSARNLGMIVPSHFVPLASPGIVSKGFRWLLNSKSPFYIRPSLKISFADWGLKFMKNASAENCAKAAVPLTQLNMLSKTLYQELQNHADFNFNFTDKGLLVYFKTELGREEELHLAEAAQKLGLDAHGISLAELKVLEPHLKCDVLGAVHYKCDAHLSPSLLLEQLQNYLRIKNTKFIFQAEVQHLERETNGSIKKVIFKDGSSENADVVVIATGAVLPVLGKKLKVNLPMIAGKGYTFDRKNEPGMQIPCILSEARVAITPFGDTIRFGGTMEIGSMNNKTNMKRVQGIVESTNSYFENIDLHMPSQEKVWFGYRPCSPDGLPYIGRLSSATNVIVAGGHSMMGLSLGAATGKIVAQLAADQKPEIDISVFNPERF